MRSLMPSLTEGFDGARLSMAVLPKSNFSEAEGAALAELVRLLMEGDKGYAKVAAQNIASMRATISEGDLCNINL